MRGIKVMQGMISFTLKNMIRKGDDEHPLDSSHKPSGAV